MPDIWINIYQDILDELLSSDSKIRIPLLRELPIGGRNLSKGEKNFMNIYGKQYHVSALTLKKCYRFFPLPLTVKPCKNLI